MNSPDNPISVGPTGIFQLDIQGLTKINDITFTTSSLNAIEKNNGYIILDYVYLDEREVS